ncbi:hypothetical protein EXS70_00960 [Candidatus Peribacteria bacterium]|nr:hypothetical protein [Candidatus Peribacteria bacterium]
MTTERTNSGTTHRSAIENVVNSKNADPANPATLAIAYTQRVGEILSLTPDELKWMELLSKYPNEQDRHNPNAKGYLQVLGGVKSTFKEDPRYPSLESLEQKLSTLAGPAH